LRPLGGLESSMPRVKDEAKYLGRKPSYTRQQFTMVRHMLGTMRSASLKLKTGEPLAVRCSRIEVERQFHRGRRASR
jgi:hypothetical protein